MIPRCRRPRWSEWCCEEHARNARSTLRLIEQHLSNARVLWQWWFAWTTCRSNYNSMMPRSSSVQSFYLYSHMLKPFLFIFYFSTNETWGLIHFCTAFYALLIGSLSPQHPPDFDIERMRQGPPRLGTTHRTAAGLVDWRPVQLTLLRAKSIIILKENRI